MKKDFKRLSEYAGELFAAGFTRKEVYEHILMEFDGTPYVWGGQSPMGSDCSGSVCTAMSLAAGKAVRVTADGLFREFFTKVAADFSDKTLLYAVFFLDEKGKAVHVAGWCGGKYMNVSSREPNKSGSFRTGTELMRLYSHLTMIKRGMRI